MVDRPPGALYDLQALNHRTGVACYPIGCAFPFGAFPNEGVRVASTEIERGLQALGVRIEKRIGNSIPVR